MHFLSKHLVILSAVMLMILFLCLFFTFGYGYARPSEDSQIQTDDPTKVLRLVHVVFRHGQRTPADTFPLDPNINQTFYPFGWGQLTNNGKMSLYETGKWLRKRYNNFLGNLYSPEVVHAQSTGVDRTKMSLELVLAGLFQPKNTALEWNKLLNWQPIPIDYETLDEDTLLLVRHSCPRYFEELQRVLEESEVKQIVEKNQDLFSMLSNKTGLKIENLDDIQSIYSTLKAEQDFGLTLPVWSKEIYPERLKTLTELSYIYNVYNDEMKKLKGGPFIKKLVKDWINLKNGTIKPKNRKLFVFAGHDSTIVNILSALNVWEQQLPTYGIMAIFELYENTITGQYSIKIELKHLGEHPNTLVIPGCDHICPIDKLIPLIQNIIPSDMKKDCTPRNSNFTEPPPRGP